MNNLKHYRTKAGLSQAQLAEKVGISHRTLQDYEQGQKPLEGARTITVLNMARTLGCTVEDLIDDKPDELKALEEKLNAVRREQIEKMPRVSKEKREELQARIAAGENLADIFKPKKKE